jgi:hypothetical protein
MMMRAKAKGDWKGGKIKRAWPKNNVLRAHWKKWQAHPSVADTYALPACTRCTARTHIHLCRYTLHRREEIHVGRIDLSVSWHLVKPPACSHRGSGYANGTGRSDCECEAGRTELCLSLIDW